VVPASQNAPFFSWNLDEPELFGFPPKDRELDGDMQLTPQWLDSDGSAA
jgi:hypothetical protein